MSGDGLSDPRSRLSTYIHSWEDDIVRTALVTGSAGFIGASVSRALLENGWRVVGLDSFSDYYDVGLKEARNAQLERSEQFSLVRASCLDQQVVQSVFDNERPEVVIHLAAQAGVRFSIDNPRTFLENNISGTFEILEAAKIYPPKHMLIASSSSVYGANSERPFSENTRSDHQLSMYAATKKSVESMAHSYSHLFNLPITMFRFFTVYGPWGRPDMAPFKFAKAICEGDPIDVYNHGLMKRDFTFIDDLTNALLLLVEVSPKDPVSSSALMHDSLSPVAPFRILNIGNNHPVALEDFIAAMEVSIGKKAIRNYMPIQSGDVPETWAGSELLEALINYKPSTPIEKGVARFVDWFIRFYEAK